MSQHQFEFEWDESKARANIGKHGVSFDLARTIFDDPTNPDPGGYHTQRR